METLSLFQNHLQSLVPLSSKCNKLVKFAEIIAKNAGICACEFPGPITTYTGKPVELPPPINWASRPIGPSGAPLVKSSQLPKTQVTNASSHQLVAFYVDADHLRELEAALSRLDITLILASGPLHEYSDHFLSLSQNMDQDASDCDQSAVLEDLTASFSTLSTLQNTKSNPLDLFPARNVLMNILSLMESPRKKRYYTVKVGRCTGVYWDTWYIYICSLDVDLV